MEHSPVATSASPLSPVRTRAKFFFEDNNTKFFVKGATYGPFAPNAQGDYLGSPKKFTQDLSLLQALGINLLRVYYTPPTWFLDLCAQARIRVLVTIPWSEHVAFLQDSKILQEIEQTVVASVQQNTRHPAIFGYLVGNEIPSTMVRWLGARAVTEFIEHLINLVRPLDPHALYSYANYPPTEYLLPQNVDFLTFNVYLHRQEDFFNYLLRLQNLAENCPLIIGEFGMDTIRHSEKEQAEIFRWHIESVVRAGLAGTVLYAWTDEWFRGGMEITDWAFGLVTRERRPKLAYETVRNLFYHTDSMTHLVPLPSYPKVSVVVCSYNGGKTLERCFNSLQTLNYPDYEVILVDDGSQDNTQEIASRYPWVQNIHQTTNQGLSAARNSGAAAATGSIIAYTDSDCMAEPDWLYYLIGTLLNGNYAGVGGPNISPPAENWVQACVAASPGGPSHVLLTDVEAEHIPGCNMAFYKWAFDAIGGFDVEYRTAGDDVDFCWRLQQNGHAIAFSPSAIVWHHRRFTLAAFRKQQKGYGEAESLLRFKHLIFFGPTGTAKWRGQIYGAPRFTWLINRPIIYHGVFGEGLFQCIYPTPQSEIAAYVSSIEWVILTIFVFCLSIPFPILRIIPYLMFGGTFLVALSYMLHAKLEPRFDTIRARLLVAFLALTQPLVRGWWRYYTWLKFKRTPPSVIATQEKNASSLSFPRFKNFSPLLYWSEEGRGRDILLPEIINSLEKEGWSYSMDTGWKEWDMRIYGSLWWDITLHSVTEYHGGPKYLTRIQLRTKMAATTFLANLIALGILGYHGFVQKTPGFWVPFCYFFFIIYLLNHARMLKRRVTQLIESAANRIGLLPLLKSKKRASTMPNSTISPEGTPSMSS